MWRRSPALRRLRRRRIPAWWQDARVGIFIHWTMAAIPAFAPRGVEFSSLLRSEQRRAYSLSPYVEWYENSLRFPESPVARFHAATYGDAPYASFRAPFDAGIDAWDPARWVEAISASGARYVVLVAKHHDGYCLWPTEVENPRRPGWHSSRDVVGELAEAVRAAGLRFGLYYSGGLDWTFDDRPMGSMGDVIAAIPRGDYPAYAEAQVRELIDRYRPSVLWNDIAWPTERARLFALFEHYYSVVPDGVVNDRWMPWSPLMALARTAPARHLIDAATLRQMRRDGGLIPPPPPHFDVRTPEYVVFDDIQPSPWECVRGMDESFGYNATSLEADFIGRDELEWLLCDIAAKGGNLMLNLGPRGVDATIPEPQATRLEWLGELLGSAGMALQGTRSWVRPGAGDRRFTTRDGAVFVLCRRARARIELPEVSVAPSSSATWPGHGPVRIEPDGLGAAVVLDRDPDPASLVVLRLENVTAAGGPSTSPAPSVG